VDPDPATKTLPSNLMNGQSRGKWEEIVRKLCTQMDKYDINPNQWRTQEFFSGGGGGVNKFS
jgi:hypothetical protein